MKVILVLGVTMLAARALGAALQEDDPSQAERTKRSGDLLGYIGNKVKSKISSFAHASAGLSSSGKHYDSPPLEYGPPLEYEHKSFDIWGFKKAVLNTLLQAVKAIKGGIIAIKGQLIKAKGHILATKGRILSAKGEAITDFGRHIASKALLSPQEHPPSGYSSAHTVEASGPGGFDWSSGAGGLPSGFGEGDHWSAPSGPAYLPPSGHSSSGGYSSYGSPSTSHGAHSGPSEVYGAPFKVARAATASQDHKPSSKEHPDFSGVQAGLLLLKPISIPEKTASSFYGSHSEPVASYVGAPRDAAVHIQKSLSYAPAASIYGF